MNLMKYWDISEKDQSSRTMTSFSTENWNDLKTSKLKFLRSAAKAQK